MNKSKFLKRSLAALLSILMVATMIPSAFAAPVAPEDALAATDDPGYTIQVGSKVAAWQNGAYVVDHSHVNDGTDTVTGVNISMIKKTGVTVTVKETKQTLTETATALDMTKATKTNAGSYGAGTYTFTLDILTTVEDTLVESSCPLVINVTATQPSGDTGIKAIKADGALAKMVRYNVDPDKEEITIVMALNATISASVPAAAATNFVVAEGNPAPTVTGTGTGTKVTVEAANKDTKTYAVKYVHEDAFSTFSLSDDKGNVYEGKIDPKNPKQVVIDVPYDKFYKADPDDSATELNNLKASWTTAKTSSKVAIGGATGGQTANFVGNIKKSGAEKLEFVAPSSQPADLAQVNGETKYTVFTTEDGANKQVYVRTKKSGTDDAAAVNIAVRVPTENPDAKLTGIQITNDGNTNNVETQYIPVPAHSGSGVQDINITLPNGVSKDAPAKVKVWGAAASEIEIALDKPTGTSGIFGSAADTPLPVTTSGAESNGNIDFSEPVTVGVTSEDGETTLLYRIVVSETSSTERILTDIKLVDPTTKKEVGTVEQDGTDITITVPYAIGSANAKLAALELHASASPSSRISYDADAASYSSADDALVKSATLGTVFDSTVVAADLDGTNGTKNVSILRVWFGAADADSAIAEQCVDYKVTLLKEAASEEAYINSAEIITKNATKTTDDGVVTKNVTVSPKNAADKTMKVTVDYARKGDVGVKFSKLDVSTGAVVLAKKPDGKYARIKFPGVAENEVTNEVTVIDSATHTDWTDKASGTTVKEIEIVVVSESEWAKVTGVTDDTQIAADKVTGVPAAGKNTYKMSATVSDPVSTASLVNVSSPLDSNVDVSVDRTGRQINISVPASYVGATPAKTFSLNIETGSPLNRVYMEATETAAKALNTNNNPFTTDGTAQTVANGKWVVSDDGDEEKTTATEFKIVKDTVGGATVYKMQYGSSTNAVSLVVAAEKYPDPTFETWTIKVTPKAVETSAEITGITAAGKSAVLNGDVWTLTVPEDTDMEQKLNITTKAKVVKTLNVDGAEFEPDEYYDLSSDIAIFVQSENGLNEKRYTLKTVTETTPPSTETGISSISVSSFVVTKTGNAYTVKVPEAEEVTALPLTINLVDSKAAVTVNGKAYTAGMTVDLTTAATIVVTAEDGTTATTYTLTAVKGDTPIPPKPSDDYTDVPAGELGDYVKQVIDNGIMKGNSATTFNPKGQITRFEFALLIARADLRVKDSAVNNADEADAELIKQYSGKSAYADPKNVELYDAAIEYCTKNSILNGVGNNMFNPDGRVTREMAAKMVTLWAKVADESLTGNDNKLNDWNSISDWAKPFVNSAYNAKFMQGVGNNNFGPNVPLTRDQVAKIIMLAYNRVSGAN